MEIAALFSVVLLLATIVAIVATQPQGSHVSISEHAASRQWSYIFFGCSLSFCGSVFLFYLLHTFGPEFRLSFPFYLAIFAGWIFLFLTAWIPDRGVHNFSNIHWRVAFGLGCCMAVIVASLGGSDKIIPAIRIAGILLGLWYCYTLYLWRFKKDPVRHFLVIQVFNIVTFMGILGLTLLTS